MQVGVAAHAHVLGVDFEYGLAAGQVGQFDGDAAVEAAGAQQRGVKALGAVGGGEDDDALGGVEAVHLRKELVERLLALVVAAYGSVVALFAYGVYLVDKDDAGRLLTGLLEEVAHLGRAHADEHLHELAAGDGKEGHVRLAGHGAGQQRLAGARRAHEQRALGQTRADVGVFPRVVEEIDDLLERLLGLVLAGHVGKGDARLRLRIELGAGFAEAHGGHTGHVAAHLFHHVAPEQRAAAEDDDQREHPAYQHVQQRGVLRRYLVGEGYLRVRRQQAVHQVVVGEDAGLVDFFLAVLIGGDEHDLLLGVLIGDLLHLAVFDHVEELVVADLRHLPLQQGGEEQRVEQHQYQQRDDVVINKASAGLFLVLFGLLYHGAPSFQVELRYFSNADYTSVIVNFPHTIYEQV